MIIRRIILSCITLMLLSAISFSQDKRTIETKIADLLAKLPANDLQYTSKLMGDMLALGEEGIKKICDQIIPAGTGDDTKYRFAVESFSRFLSGPGKETERTQWEKICLTYALSRNDKGVIDFFIKQIQLTGGDASIEFLKKYLTDTNNCYPAVSAISAIGGKKAEEVFAESLKDKNLPCAAAVMNALAAMKSQLAVNEYITWSDDVNVNTVTSAYNALARSGSPQAYPVLLNAARSYQYRWERTGATSALLGYAGIIGEAGDMKTADKICKLLISKCNDKLTIQNKTAALKIYISLHGLDAMKYLLKAASHPDKKYRNSAIGMTSLIKDEIVVKNWIDYFPKAIPDAKPEIIVMLGDRGDRQALPLLTGSLSDQDPAVRTAAAEAVTKLSGKGSVPQLIGYLMKYNSSDDQAAAVAALKSVSGNSEIAQLKPVLKDGSTEAKISAIGLMAWNKNQEYFYEILPFSSSSDEKIKAASINALVSLAGPGDQKELIRLIAENNNPAYLADLQVALAAAANKTADPGRRSAFILEAMPGISGKEKLIPVLAKTGGREALAVVLREFENGTSEIREVCFKALTSWRDYSASSALYEICASGNKTYEAPAFAGYVRQIRSSSLPDEQKLLLFRKIMPYALSPERKNEILTEIGKLKTYQALFFTANYLDDPATSATAAKSVMYIALPSVSSRAGMYGTNVREILSFAMTKLKGQESEYDREMIKKYLDNIPAGEGFVSMFNGKDLSGWQGLVENPLTRARMKPDELAKKQAGADKKVPLNWSARDGCIWFNGRGENLCSVKEYSDFELLVDWKISKAGDSGIYLRGTPQVQIWDTSRVQVGAQVGSGGLYNNQKNPSKPLKVADNPVGEWNSFRIIMIGDKTSVWLNGELVVDNITLENYWDRGIPIFTKGPIELQAHGTDLAFRDIYIREIGQNDYNLTPGEKSELKDL